MIEYYIHLCCHIVFWPLVSGFFLQLMDDASKYDQNTQISLSLKVFWNTDIETHGMHVL